MKKKRHVIDTHVNVTTGTLNKKANFTATKLFLLAYSHKGSVIMERLFAK